MKKFSQILIKLLNSCRFKRTLWPTTMFLVPVAWTGVFNPIIIHLAAVMILLYGAVALHNAFVDGDHGINKYEFHTGILCLLIPAISLAVSNLLVLAVLIAYILIGFFYNTISRLFLFGDNLVLMISHVALPMFLSGLVVGMPLNELVLLIVTSALTFFSVASIRNFKDIVGDSTRSYKTIVTIMPLDKALNLMKVMIAAGMLIAFVPYLLLEINPIFIPIYLTFVSSWKLIYDHLSKLKFRKALSMSRFAFFLHSIALMVARSINPFLLGITLVLMFSYGGIDFLFKDYG